MWTATDEFCAQIRQFVDTGSTDTDPDILDEWRQSFETAQAFGGE